ncbi:MAG: hypothetical protein WAV31_00690 [Candidatus Moraniibacteriota bacterium]
MLTIPAVISSKSLGELFEKVKQAYKEKVISNLTTVEVNNTYKYLLNQGDLDRVPLKVGDLVVFQ